MNLTDLVCCDLLAEARVVPAPQSYLGWAYDTLDPLHGLAIVSIGLVVFLVACLAVFSSRRPALIAACLVLLPLPLMAGLHGALHGQIHSLAVMAMSPQVSPSGPQIAAGVASALLPLSLALSMTWPSYLVLAVGLIVRTMRSKEAPAD